MSIQPVNKTPYTLGSPHQLSSRDVRKQMDGETPMLILFFNGDRELDRDVYHMFEKLAKKLSADEILCYALSTTAKDWYVSSENCSLYTQLFTKAPLICDIHYDVPVIALRMPNGRLYHTDFLFCLGDQDDANFYGAYGGTRQGFLDTQILPNAVDWVERRLFENGEAIIR